MIEERIYQVVRVAAVVAAGRGCLVVLQPFLGAILSAAIRVFPLADSTASSRPKRRPSWLAAR